MGRLSSSTIEQLIRRVGASARSGVSMATFAAEVDCHLRAVIPHSAACVITLDPASGLLTGTYKFGGLDGQHHLDGQWAELEYGTDDPTRLSTLADEAVPARATSHLPGGVDNSVRMRRLIGPMGYDDELRMVARSNSEPWGGVNLFRAEGEPQFTEDEVTALAAASEAVANGIRSSLVARSATTIETDQAGSGPLVLITDAEAGTQRISTGAADLLDELTSEPNRSPAESLVRSLVTHARRFANGQESGPPRARMRLPSGRWLVAHASPLTGGHGPTGEIVVTIDDARPPDVVPLLASAFGLTERERDVTQLVLTGIDTKTIASTLSMSRYTVQDHLKSIFDKADVHSRRELMARVFFDQYAPRLTEEVGPTGWFRSP